MIDLNPPIRSLWPAPPPNPEVRAWSEAIRRRDAQARAEAMAQTDITDGLAPPAPAAPPPPARPTIDAAAIFAARRAKVEQLGRERLAREPQLPR
jgi:hypothetical protein